MNEIQPVSCCDKVRFDEKSSEKIKVNYCHGVYMLWNINDAMLLRRQHRICGNMVGALAEYPRQNRHNGLPLVLSSEEIRFLNQMELIDIVEIASTNDEPKSNQSTAYFASEDCQSFYRQLAEQQYKQINQHYKEARRAEIEANLDQIVQGKLQKTEQQLHGDELVAFHAEVHRQLIDSIVDLPKNSSGLLTRFHLHAPYPRVPLYHHCISSLEPSSLAEIKYAVFVDLWHKGYYLSCGLKFGAHFLVYDGDPIVFHAKFMVNCLISSQDQFDCSLHQVYGRLGKNVRKNMIIAFFEESNSTDVAKKKRLVYKHVQWNSVGLA